jgi:hypothetical protein
VMERVNSATKQKVIEWFCTGNVGQSSRSIVKVTLGFEPKYADYPRDPSDFARCVKLLRAVPELKSRMKLLKGYCSQWDQLLENWDALERLLFDECGQDFEKSNSAPLTYKAMKGMGC